jgi:small subunit ribosomal protein S6
MKTMNPIPTQKGWDRKTKGGVMENLYSTIFIVDISQNPDEVETVSSRIQQLIEDHGGIIKKIDSWGKRRLAYHIEKKTHGSYVEMEFTANSHLNIPKILEDEYRLNDRVLRHLTYNIQKKELMQRAKDQGKALAEAKAEQASKEKKLEETSQAAPKPEAAGEPAPEVAEAGAVAAEAEVSGKTEPESQPDAKENEKKETVEQEEQEEQEEKEEDVVKATEEKPEKAEEK